MVVLMANAFAAQAVVVWAGVTERLAALIVSCAVSAVPGVAVDVYVPALHAFVPLQIVSAVLSIRV